MCRARGIRLLVYLDDFIILGESVEQCHRDTQFVLQLLEQLGWLVNVEKSVLEPKTKLEFLGFVLDTVDVQPTGTERQEKEVPELMQAAGKTGNKKSYGEVKNASSGTGQTPKHSPSSTFRGCISKV